jgi:hypothetical protein
MVTEARALATVHALHQAGQSLSVAPPGPLLAVHLVMVPLSWWRPRAAMAVVALLGLVQCGLAFPRTGNHLMLGVVVSLVLALLDERDPEETSLRRASFLALVLIVFVWSGVHKVWHGLWFRGETLAWLSVSRGDVGALLRPFFSDGLAQRLASLSRTDEGSGPFRLEGAWLLVSNAVWLGELGAAAFWHRRLRPLAAPVLLVMVWLVQFVAHEWEFALLLTNLLVPGARLRWLVAAGVVGVMAVRLGWVVAPFWAWHAPEPT